MTSLTRLLTLALVSSSAVAVAQPEVRDHRTAPSTGESSTATIHYRKRPGPRFMMPLKVDIGAVGADARTGFANGIAASVGIHWASLSPQPTNTDVGIGVFGALLSAPAAEGQMTTNGIAYGGAYLEVGHTLAQGSFWRTWAAGRGEYVGSTAFDESKKGFGAAGRLSAEFYISGAGIEPRGLFLGTYAIGVYAEVGARDMVGGLGNVQASGGLTFRTPLVFSP